MEAAMELQTLAARPAAFESYGEYFSALRSLASQYGNLPQSGFYKAWAQAAALTNPYIQNNRVKRVSTLPGNYDKKSIVQMLKSPQNNEEELRSVDRNCRLIKGQVFLWEGAHDWLDLWDVDGTIPGWNGYERKYK
jgi:hypothetical protein